MAKNFHYNMLTSYGIILRSLVYVRFFLMTRVSIFKGFLESYSQLTSLLKRSVFKHTRESEERLKFGQCQIFVLTLWSGYLRRGHLERCFN